MTRKEKNNYIKLGIILIGTVLLTIVSANIYRNYENNKSNINFNNYIIPIVILLIGIILLIVAFIVKNNKTKNLKK